MRFNYLKKIIYGIYLGLLLTITVQEVTSQLSPFNTFFDWHSNVELVDAKTNHGFLSSVTLLQCVFHCQEHSCTVLEYEKNKQEGACTIYKLPLKKVKLSPTNTVIGKDTLVIKPCSHPNNNCLHEGLCNKNVSSVKGFDCTCVGEWTGELCEKSKYME